MNQGCIHSRTRKWIAIFLALALGAGLTSSVHAAPLRQYQGDLVLQGFGSDRQLYCTGEKVTYHGFVLREVPTGLFSSSLYNLPGATVMVNGWPKATTDADGKATWNETAKEPGDVQFYVTASKPGYADSGQATISYTVMECEYDLQIQYDESYVSPAIGNGGTFTEFAAVRLQGKLVPTQDGKLVSASGGNMLTGKFVMKGIFSLGFDVFSCTPKGLSSEGNLYYITFTGTVDANGGVTLKLEQGPINLPTMVEWTCSKDPNDRIPKMMSVSFPSANLIERAGLGTLSFPNGNGSRAFTVPGGVFWAIKDIHSEGSISLTVYKPGSTLIP